MTLSHGNKTSTCNTCIYLHRTSDEDGQCRRHSPILFEGSKEASFPWVTPLEDWCGEYSGNIQPLSAAETRAAADPTLMSAVVFVKPTPYRDSKEFTDYGN